MSIWKELLHGSLAERAVEATHAIARDLSPEISRVREGSEGQYPHSVGFGDAGIALFFSYLFQCSRDPRWAANADYYLSRAFDAVQNSRTLPDLFRGFAGVGWAFQHAAGRVYGKLDNDDATNLEEIDATLMKWCHAEYVTPELMEGLGGICIYALEGIPRPSAKQLLSVVILEIERRAEMNQDSVTWPASQVIRSLFSRDSPLTRHLYRPSVAHGVAGTAGALAGAYAAFFDRERVTPMILGSVQWILNQQSPSVTKQTFPLMVGVECARLSTGWCSGDLGICLVLYNISKLAGRDDWISATLRIARSEALRTVENVEWEYRSNYSLCHGSAGRGHFLNRLFQYTGDDAFGEAARRWFTLTLDMRRPNSGTGGFLLDDRDDTGLKDRTGILMGASGLGLALLAATTDVEPAWDRLFAASFRAIPIE